MASKYIETEPIIKFIVDGLNNPDLTKAFGHDAIEILTEIEYAPKVDMEPVVHARWGDKPNLFGYTCSLCEKIMVPEFFNGEMNYCPNCGAKMSKEDNYAH